MSQAGILNVAGSGGGGSPVETLTGNSGGAVPPTANNINVVGDGTTITIAGNPGTSTLTASVIQGGIVYYSLTPYIVGSDVHSQYTTITAAITAGTLAGVPFNVYVKPGTYAESITLVDGCNIIALAPVDVGELELPLANGNVIVTGGVTFTAAGKATVIGITFNSTSTPVNVTGANNTTLIFSQCFINANSGVATFNITTSGSSRVSFDNTQINNGNGATVGTINASNSIIEFINGSSMIFNDSTNTFSNGSFRFYNSRFSGSSATLVLTATSGTSEIIDCDMCPLFLDTGVTAITVMGNRFSISGGTTVIFTYNSTAATGHLKLVNNYFDYATSDFVVQGTSTKILSVANNSAVLHTSSSLPIPIVSPTLIAALTTYNILDIGSIRIDSLHTNVTLPAGDYTIVSNDNFVGADTTGARAITLPASPTVGRTLRIKDVTGTANAHNITIGGNGKNIDGSASYVINANFGSIDLIYSGTAWFVV